MLHAARSAPRQVRTLRATTRCTSHSARPGQAPGTSGLALLGLLAAGLLLLLLRELLRKDLLHALLLLDEEGAQDARADAVPAARAAVGPGDTAEALLDAAVLHGPQCRDTQDLAAAVAAARELALLLEVVGGQLPTGGLHPLDLVRPRVVVVVAAVGEALNHGCFCALS